jgi:hypothetical protein
MYISRLVKTRDPYPGLLQFAILSLLSFLSLPFIVIIHLLFLLSHLYSIIIDLVEVLLRPFHYQGI